MNRADLERIKQSVADGLLSTSLEPLKCMCGSTEFKDETKSVDGGRISESERSCAKCKTVLGYWAYGGWQV